MKAREVDHYLKAHHKLALVLGAILCMTAVSGYFMGVRQTLNFSDENREQREHNGEVAPPAGEVPTAVPYRELEGAGLQPNAGWRNVITSLPSEPVVDKEEPNALSKSQLRSVLAARRSRRAFDGAPPVVPHPITQRRASSCLLCHGKRQPLIAGEKPPRISHENFASCTQCHVTADGPGEGFTDPDFGITVANAFLGRVASEAGSRAYRGAPPTVPHPTLMREDCMSCHGPDRAHALVTSHPGRQSCNQCHASSADLDQRKFDLAAILDPVRFEVRAVAPKPAPVSKGQSPGTKGKDLQN